jgi:hypothetical protein
LPARSRYSGCSGAGRHSGPGTPANPIWLLVYRLLFTVAAWTLLSSAFAWHDGVAPPVWFRNDITGILIFALPQLVLQGAFTFPLDPRDVRRVTALGDADVGRITAHMRGPEVETREPPEPPTS